VLLSPDGHHAFEDGAEGDKVVTRGTFSGTHQRRKLWVFHRVETDHFFRIDRIVDM